MDKAGLPPALWFSAATEIRFFKSGKTRCDHQATGQTHRDCCDRHVNRLFDDENESVRQNCSAAFWNMKGERLLQLESTISSFVESRSFETEPQSLLMALNESRAELPKVVCRSAERVLEFIGEEGGNLANSEASSAYSLSTLVVRQYAQSTEGELKRHCLDLIDEMERRGYMGIADELGKLDR